MATTYFATLPEPWGWVVSAVLGLIVGSFLNVVIHRLPRMLERRWAAECAALQAPAAGGTGDAAAPAPERYDLLAPRSHCPACHTPIRWYHNIPVLSWLALRGRCAACAAPIDPASMNLTQAA